MLETTSADFWVGILCMVALAILLALIAAWRMRDGIKVWVRSLRSSHREPAKCPEKPQE